MFPGFPARISDMRNRFSALSEKTGKDDRLRCQRSKCDRTELWYYVMCDFFLTQEVACVASVSVGLGAKKDEERDF